MNLRVREHPGHASLFDHAEQLESGRIELGSAVAAHVRECAKCGAEVESMRRSLSLTRLASRTIEPTVALEASTILAMKSQWLSHRRTFRRRLMKSAGFAAVFTVVMSVSLSSSESPTDSGIAKSYPRANQVRLDRSYETLLLDSPEEVLLEPAIRASNWRPESRWEKAQSRKLETFDRDIEAALAAFEANPALVRAGMVIDANRESKRQTLKSLYAQRNL